VFDGFAYRVSSMSKKVKYQTDHITLKEPSALVRVPPHEAKSAFKLLCITPSAVG
jgi:hypothetical protein